MINKKRLTMISILVLIFAVVMAVVMTISLPGQFDEEIRRTVSTLENHTASDLTLAIMTDMHYDPSKNEPSTVMQTCTTIRKIRDRLAGCGLCIDALWNLGDFINGHNTTKEEACGQIGAVIAAQKEVIADYHNIAGNHDNNIQATYQSNAGLPKSEVLSVSELNSILENTETAQTEHHNMNWPTDYYVDFPTIRVVCLSADEVSFMPETVSWLQNEALSTGHEVLVLSHIPTRPEWGFRNDVSNGKAIENALSSFVATGGTVIAYIHGHDHGDIINTVTADDGSFLFHEIGIGCARFSCSTANGTPGMKYRERNEDDETMILFDIVSIDQTNRIVYFTRVGAGDDREIRY